MKKKSAKNKTHSPIIFVDESGVHKQDGHSTTALISINIEDVGKVDTAVLEAENKLKIKPFHWAEQGWKVRRAFLEEVRMEEYEVKIFVFTNPFTEEKFERALRHLIVEKFIKTIVIDGKKSRSYALRLKKVLRQSGIHVKNIRTGNDRSYPALRVADLFAGLVRAYADSPDDDKIKKLYDIISNKITIRLTDGQVPGSLFL